MGSVPVHLHDAVAGSARVPALDAVHMHMSSAYILASKGCSTPTREWAVALPTELRSCGLLGWLSLPPAS